MVALSGVLIPGPLLIYVLGKSSEAGVKTGPLSALGHFSVELPLILMIVLGVHVVLQSLPVTVGMGVLGGILLTIFGVKGFLSKSEGRNPRGFTHLNLHPYVGGIAFSTILNPSVPLWWATLGFALLLDAYLIASYLGIIFWSIGHFTADLAWYTFIAYAVWSGRKTILKHQESLMKACSLVLTGFGLYFLVKYVPQICLLL
ncbi:MAG: LysE family transporter [Candidatus Hecatellaceae archaeon]